MLKKAGQLGRSERRVEAYPSVRRASERCENAAGVIFQHPAHEGREGMMFITGRSFRGGRLVDLERTVDFLNGQVRKMQGELHRAKAVPIPIRLWRNLVSRKGGQEFMSAVCNRRVRPNTKMIFNVNSRA